MTVKNVFENILAIFPTAGEAQILFEIDNAQKRVAEDTKILTARGELSAPSSNVAWVLPSDFLELQDITFYDSNGKPLYMKNLEYAYEIEFGKLYIYSTNATVITSLSARIDKAYIHYSKAPASITSTSGTFSIGEEFHEAIEAKALSRMFAKFPTAMVVGEGVVNAINLRSAQWWEREYDKIRIRLKKKRYSNSDYREGMAINYGQAGIFELPRRAKDSVVSTVLQPITSGVYSKYAVWKITYSISDIVVEEILAPSGFSGTVSCAVSGTTLTITSTESDFTNIMDFNSNKDDVIVTSFSATEWVFSIPSGDFGVMRMEIFE